MPMPPPPPPGGLALGDSRKTNFKPNPSADGRGLLLDSIRKGTKLKKTETVDKSAPVLGRVVGSTTSPSSSKPYQSTNTSSLSANIGANGQPLAGIFANGMPKLKPTGNRNKNFLREKQPEQSYKAVPMEQASATVVSTSVNNTLHTKTKSNVEVTSKYSNPEIKRGPPPQPPVQRTQMPLSASDSTIAGFSPTKPSNAGSMANLSSNSNYSSSTLKKNIKTNSVMNLNQSSIHTPNQSTLFANKSNLHASLSSLSQNNKLSTPDSSSLLSLSSQKSVINHGKPNLAPKPPTLNSSGKPGVMRAHSMKSPRTPPVTPPGLTPFGTLRGPPAGFYQSQDSIKMKPAPPIPQIGRPSIPPPIRPPANRPPPPPNRSTSSSVTTNSINNNSQPQNKPALPSKLLLTGSHNVQTTIAGKQVLNLTAGVNNTPMGVPPPPPPHRTQPAPQPPAAMVPGRTVATNNTAPVPPIRNSSMRNCNGNNGSMSAVIVDLETRFSDMFHTVKDFPLPIKFCELQKTYNSKNHFKQQANSVCKQQSFSKPQAPLPPMQTPTIQLGRKLYSDDATDC
uniref:Putative verprolin 1 corethrella appendiculata n=1 Tax=Xenopsylla cheopis TaxID=163159 RepID=A0A6M2DEC2_XENCH